MDLFKTLFNLGDNYYQSEPDSFLIKMLTTVLPIFLSGLISFWITYYMFKRQTLEKDLAEKNRINELREYIYYCIKYLIKRIDEQIITMNKSIEEFTKDVIPETYCSMHRPMEIIVGLNLDQIVNLEVKDTFKILVIDCPQNSNNIRNYHYLMDSNELLTDITKQINKINKWAVKIDKTNLAAVVELEAQINEIITCIESKNDNKHDSLEYLFIIEVINIWRTYEKKVDGNLEDIMILLVNKIIELFKSDKYANCDKKDEINFHNLTKTCNKVSFYYMNIIEGKKFELKNLKLWIDNLESNNEVYRDIISRVYPEKMKEIAKTNASY